MANVTLNPASGPDEPPLVAVKLQAPEWEFNFRAAPAELAALGTIRDTDWAARQTLHIGQCGDAAVHWAAEGETATILVGHDDETWDIALMIPVSAVDEIVAAALAAQTDAVVRPEGL